jgi:hypothetical protein
MNLLDSKAADRTGTQRACENGEHAKVRLGN